MKLYDDKKFIGKVIRTARKRAGLKQSQLAEILEMSDKNIGNIENGKQFPQVNNFLRILEALNLGIEEFGVPVSKTKINNFREKITKELCLATDKELEFYYELIKHCQKSAHIFNRNQ